MINRFAGTLVLLAAMLLLTACNETGSGRPLSYSKGTYIGPADEKLNEEARQKLRSRMSIQGAGNL